MQVSLNKVFPIDASSDEAWALLEDIEEVVECMPGAEITEMTDTTEFKGKVKVKLGPVSVAFSGDTTVDVVDATERRIHLVAKGQDSKGSSSVNMDLTAFIKVNESDVTELVGEAKVTVNGKLASFGGRMMTQVANQILAQFADNFSDKLQQAAIESAGGENSRAALEQAIDGKLERKNEINALQLAWNVVIGFFKNLFGIKT